MIKWFKSLFDSNYQSVSINQSNNRVGGKVYNGRNIQICNGKVIIDGVTVADSSTSTIGDITIEGNVESLNIDMVQKVIVKGSVKSLESSQGDVYVEGSVEGSIESSMGDISVKGDVKGNCKTSMGDINR
jgi:cytoskeletal protein CcmA (bactofilin family)